MTPCERGDRRQLGARAGARREGRAFPVAAIVLVFQRRIVQGLTSGAVK
jgi:hypothetical protein